MFTVRSRFTSRSRFAKGSILNVIPTAVLILAAVMALAGCGQGQAFDRDTASASFASANPDASQAQADCVVDRLIDRYGLERLETELSAETAEDSFSEDQYRDMFACGMEGDVREQIIEQLEANDVQAEDAPCVADELVGDLDDEDFDVLLSGEITDAFLAKFITAMESCGAINS